MTKAVADFIEALLVHYPVRHDTEEREDAWVNSMTGALRSYGADLLNEVAQEVIRTRKYRNFPLLSEILDKCDEIETRREARKREATLPAMRNPNGDEWSSERVKLAYDLIKSGMGKQAAQDNPSWILALWHFCRRHQRLPADAREVDQCKRAALDFDEAYEDALRGSVVDQFGQIKELANGRALQNLGASMLAKREKLRTEVLGR